jgi:hypothetical protein
MATITLSKSDTATLAAGETWPLQSAMERASKLASRLRLRVVIESADGRELADVVG